MCSNTYFDRTGLYKHKIRYHPTPNGQAVDKSISDNAAATAHGKETTTADSILTSQPTAASLQIDNPTASHINQSIQRSPSELDSTSPANAMDAFLPIDTPLHNDVNLEDLHISPSETELVNQILTSGNAVSDSNNELCLSQSVQDIVMPGKITNWTLPQGLLTSDASVNKWLNELSLKIIKKTMHHVATQLNRTLIEGIAAGDGTKAVAEFYLKLDNIIAQI